ncbi:MAG: hypothetical protein ACXWX7_08445 [Candidatus Binatia bacterium]
MQTPIAIGGKIKERRIRAGGTSFAQENFVFIFERENFPRFMTERKMARADRAPARVADEVSEKDGTDAC